MTSGQASLVAERGRRKMGRGALEEYIELKSIAVSGPSLGNIAN
jgi:hypothetical protein